jgi:hypothetical protein
MHRESKLFSEVISHRDKYYQQREKAQLTSYLLFNSIIHYKNVKRLLFSLFSQSVANLYPKRTETTFHIFYLLTFFLELGLAE